jgi:hypothetical protein
VLNDENCERISSPELPVVSNEQTNTYVNSQIHEYRSKAQSKFENRKNQTHPQLKEKKNYVHAKKTGTEKQREIKKIQVIGDSMVTHIDRVKIERAAGCQSVVHSYSGARVEQISSKVNEYWQKGSNMTQFSFMWAPITSLLKSQKKWHLKWMALSKTLKITPIKLPSQV